MFNNISLTVKSILLASAIAHTPPAIAAQSLCLESSSYRTDRWGDKLIYGSLSTLISSYVIGIEYPRFVRNVQDPNVSVDQLKREAAQIRQRYSCLSDFEVKKILDLAGNDRSLTVYEEERSALLKEAQRSDFMAAMTPKSNFRPGDYAVNDGYFTDLQSYQTAAHRALYNNAFGIPQNSLAAVFNSYLSGITTIEIDVLETASSDKYRNIIIHDLTTNRLNGDYNNPPHYVGMHGYEGDLEKTSLRVVNPMSDIQESQSTPVPNLVTLDRLFAVVRALTPSATLYLDARNDSPVSYISVLKDNSDVKDRFISKVYPFTLTRGYFDIVSKYAERTGAEFDKAWSEIYSIRPLFLMVVSGSPNQISDDVYVNKVSDFDLDRFQNITSRLPFSRNSSQSFNKFAGDVIFSSAELALIEAQTFKLFRWSTDMNAIGNVLVLQESSRPSLVNVVNRTDAAEFAKMSQDDKIAEATTDNYNALLLMIKDGSVPVFVSGPSGEKISMTDVLRSTLIGISDRYPDFTVAGRLSDDQIDEGMLNDFVYNIKGPVVRPKGYAAEKSQSAKASAERFDELNQLGLTARVITTDIPIDLRAVMWKRSFPQYNLPDDQRFHYNAVVKEKFNPSDISKFDVAGWTKRLYGDVYVKYPTTLDADIAKINSSETLRDVYLASATVLQAAESSDTFILTNADSLKRLAASQPVLSNSIDREKLKQALASASLDYETARVNTVNLINQFEKKYGVPYFGSQLPSEY